MRVTIEGHVALLALGNVDEHLWRVYYGALELGRLDARTTRIEPKSEKVLPMFPDRTVTHQPSYTPLGEGERISKSPPRRSAPPLLGEEGTGVVVYGEQCLAPQTCFTWQRWPAGS